MNENQLCRLCMSLSGPEKVKNLKEIDQISKNKINEIFGSKVQFEGNMYPLLMCNECHKTLFDVYQFYQIVISSQEKLKEIVFRDSEIEKVDNEGIEASLDSKNCTVEAAPMKIDYSLEAQTLIGQDKMVLEFEINEINDLSCSESQSCQDEKNKIIRLESTTHHSVKIKQLPYICDKCGTHFQKKNPLSQHIRKCHLKKNIPCICDICGKKFVDKSAFGRHYKTIHSTNAKINCQLCGSVLAHERALQRHMINLHELNGPWICNICGKTSTTRDALISHKRIHTTQKRHECHVCGRKFMKPIRLREHLTIHFDTPPLYKCMFCPKTFSSNGNMYKHRKKMHAKEIHHNIV